MRYSSYGEWYILIHDSFRTANRWPSNGVKTHHLRDYSSEPKRRYALIGILGKIDETHLITASTSSD